MSEIDKEETLKDEPQKDDIASADEQEKPDLHGENGENEEKQNSEAKSADDDGSQNKEPGTSSEENTGESKTDEVDYHDKWLRVTAEYQNYRTRTIKEKEEIYQNANAKFVEDLLEVIDNFERAMNSKPKESDAFTDGIELIYKQFLAVLDKNHVKEIPALGEKFDPKVHMAIHAKEVEGTESDIVVEVIKKGYTINEKVIRPSMVVVSQ